MLRRALSAAALTLALAGVTAPSIARGGTDAAGLNGASVTSPSPWRLAVGTTGGSVFFDPALTNYRWDVEATAAWGLMASLGKDRWNLGARLERSSTTQATGIPGEPRAPSVRLTSVTGTASFELVRLWRVAAAATGHAGRLHLGYSPDRLELDPLGGGETIEVEYAPIDDWTAGVGLSLTGEVAWSLAMGLHVERSYFWLSTSHRVGSEIEQRRERFGNWAARLALSWTLEIP
jgi:hypothetical protein